MFGAIYGDIVGSVYEFHNIRKKDFELFGIKSEFTDDTVMTLAVANALVKFDDQVNSDEMYELGKTRGCCDSDLHSSCSMKFFLSDFDNDWEVSDLLF